MSSVLTYKIINSIGLLMDIIGVLLVFLNSPIMQSVTYISSPEQNEVMRKRDRRKNISAKVGLTLIVLGFVVQISSNFI